MTLFDKIVFLILTPISVISVIAFLIKVLFNQFLNKDLEKYRIELTRSLEDYKNHLEIDRIRFQSKFSITQERKANVISDFYTKLSRLYRFSKQLIATFQPGGQELLPKKQLVLDALNDFWSYYEDHKIYFDHELRSNIENIFDRAHTAFLTFHLSQPDDGYSPDESGQWRESWRIIKDEVPPLMNDLEMKFKHILGLSE